MRNEAIPTRVLTEGIELQSPIFEYADNEEQKFAILKFINSMREYTNDSNKLGYIKEIEDLASTAQDSIAAVRMAISCFDFCVSDEIRVYEGDYSHPSDDAAVYFRSDAYKTKYPDSIILSISAKLGYAPSRIVIADRDSIYRSFSGKKIGMLTHKLSFAVNDQNQLLDLPYPPISVPRQELYSELLHCGINPVENLVPPKETPNFSDNEVYRRFHRLRSRNFFYTSEIGLAQRENNIESHWLSIMEESQDSHISLCSSGVSSNEIAIRIVAEYCNDVYVHPYWYYENLPGPRSAFNIQNSIEQSTALLINLEPTNYFSFGPKPESPINLILQFVKNAQQNQEQLFFLVIDTTVDPTFSIRDLTAQQALPKNLKIIKTLSATKHQDGGRNYFFGAIYTEGNDMHNLAKNNIDFLQAKPSEFQIIHFPTPSKKRIEDRRKISKNYGEILEQLTATSNIWRYESYSYNSFLLPQAKLIKNLSDSLDKLSSVDSRNQYITSVNRNIYSIVQETVSKVGGSIEFGDSFAFPVTRVNTQGGLNVIGNHVVSLKIPRVSIGYKDGEKQGLYFAVLLAENLNNLGLNII